MALLGDLILVAGSDGLTILDSTTLEKRGSITTTGDATSVDGLSDVGFDINGDGEIDPGAEIIDMAILANGTDGTIQFFDVSEGHRESLLSIVVRAFI